MGSAKSDGGGDAPAPLLRFRLVEKSVRDGEREVELLAGASFELQAGASAGLFGQRRSGKSMLLRLACGVELPDRGSVNLAGRELANLSSSARARLLAQEIALIAPGCLLAPSGQSVLDTVITATGSAGLPLAELRRRALAALDRVQCAGLAAEAAGSLSAAQWARVELAGALTREPRLMLVDEPTPTPSLREREALCALMRSLCEQDGIALLIASEDLGALQGLQALMSLSGGELVRAVGHQDNVVALPRASAASRA